MEGSAKVYFASDFHLGYDDVLTSEQREVIIVDWLGSISQDAKSVYLLGDIFDYWFEYRSVVPAGYNLLLAQLKMMTTQGIAIHYLTGNHDLWQRSFLQSEIGVTIHHQPIELLLDGKKFYLAHGDGLKGEKMSYFFFKSLMKSPLCQKLYSLIHPTIGLWLMKKMSLYSRARHQKKDNAIDANRLAIDFCENHRSDFHYYIMGHYHHPMIHVLVDGVRKYVNLGDWISYFTYAVWDGNILELKDYRPPSSQVS